MLARRPPHGFYLTRVPRSTAAGPHFRALQAARFSRADRRHFRWQTGTEFFSGTERALFEDVPIEGSTRILEVGCGEGGNLVNLFARGRQRPRFVAGVDLFYQKVRFAAAQVPQARFLCADAARLPLKSESFDLVICRDVLHHVDAPDKVLRELRRVCAPRGTVLIIEPNGRNPLMHLFALSTPSERAAHGNSPASVTAAVSRHFASFRVIMKQPFPLFRAVLHYRYGLPWLERVRWITAAMARLDRFAGRVVPPDRWAYIVIVCHKLGRHPFNCDGPE